NDNKPVTHRRLTRKSGRTICALLSGCMREGQRRQRGRVVRTRGVPGRNGRSTTAPRLSGIFNSGGFPARIAYQKGLRVGGERMTERTYSAKLRDRDLTAPSDRL